MSERGQTLPLIEALERLRWPEALEAYSGLTGQPLLAIDLRDGAPRAGAEAIEQLRRVLSEVPCPTIGLSGQNLDDSARALLASFDVIVTDENEAAAVVDRVRARPQAAAALVQLLRLGEVLDVHEGLIAESLTYSMLQSGPEFAGWLASRERRPAAAVAQEDAVLAERDGRVLRLTLNRPERRNAFSVSMRDRLAELLAAAVADDSVEEIVLCGSGPAFCSGGDLDEFGTLPDPATAHLVRSTRNVARLLAACGPRVTAEVHGACVGAGVELAAFARRVLARGDATFELPEVGMGLVPGAGGTVSIPRRIGRQRTAYMALTGEPIDVSTALRWGLVDRVVD
ncbi:MAG: enoyl-CoA hydratase/isomerase family protein [Deltaproteobacteria bacterium]|nr:MAG: enoyl-CoA hydratase/isomerase family protein [Deltaproteobacteria bacterium]